MTKTDLITAINTQLTAIITQAKVRLASLQLVNELFPAETNQIITTGNVTCNLVYKKTGNEARVEGWIKNNTSNIIGSQVLVTIPNAQYYAKTGNETIINVVGETSLQNGLLSISGTSLYLIYNLGANNRIYINASYQTND